MKENNERSSQLGTHFDVTQKTKDERREGSNKEEFIFHEFPVFIDTNETVIFST